MYSLPCWYLFRSKGFGGNKLLLEILCSKCGQKGNTRVTNPSMVVGNISVPGITVIKVKIFTAVSLFWKRCGTAGSSMVLGFNSHCASEWISSNKS